MALEDLRTEFVGRKGALFRLAFWASIKTVLTLGFYRFWMKTRLRRYYWSGIRPGGHPMEYVGEPLEKLLGFLIAVVFLAFYIGIVNLILMFISFSLLDGPGAAYALSFVGVIPLWFYAQYRARRYVLARTRWRGIRFGLEPGAWGYAWRALVHWALAILTLGILWPRKTFWLEKYKTDRTYYGDLLLEQTGKWTMLLPAAKHVILAVLVSAGIGALGYFGERFGLLFLLMITVPWALFGMVYYSVNATRILTDHKKAGGVGLVATPRTGRVLGIYVGGYFLVYLSMMGAATVFAVLGGILAGATLDIWDLIAGDVFPIWMITLFGMVVYFTIFILYGVFSHVFVSLPLYEHYSETLVITGSEHLPDVEQRDRDEFSEAEGFAEALDVGAAI